jgi:hypothetical protein
MFKNSVKGNMEQVVEEMYLMEGSGKNPVV